MAGMRSSMLLPSGVRPMKKKGTTARPDKATHSSAIDRRIFLSLSFCDLSSATAGALLVFVFTDNSVSIKKSIEMTRG